MSLNIFYNRCSQIILGGLLLQLDVASSGRIFYIDLVFVPVRLSIDVFG